MGREKYILNDELAKLADCLDETSVLMIYQHLTRNKNKQINSLREKIKQAVSSTNHELVLAYREDDLAFIFVMKGEDTYESLGNLLAGYHEKSGYRYKSMHYASTN